MPYKDGLEALTEIRSNPKFKNLPLIIYSTTKSEYSINACYEKGADLFVVEYIIKGRFLNFGLLLSFS